MLPDKSTTPTTERAVSPVVGVILMVAITVILAAVIGTFVLNLGSDQTEPAQAGIAFERTTVSGNNAIRASLSDAGNVDSLRVVEAGTTNSVSYPSPPSVGDSVTVCESGAGGVSGCDLAVGSNTGTLQVIGTNDGKENIVSETSYDLN